eukprot:SM000042S15378  [mRNA]  locus=s42:631135:633087:- [translate_table: standard]
MLACSAPAAAATRSCSAVALLRGRSLGLAGALRSGAGGSKLSNWRLPCKNKEALRRSTHSAMAPAGAQGGTADGATKLADKKCIPCSTKDMKPLGREDAEAMHAQVREWDLSDVDGRLQLQRSWKLKNFVKGIELFERIATVAEAEGHHPDLHLEGWNNVRVEISTHSIGGLTENDFILAAKIGALDTEDLLRKPRKVQATGDA